MYSDKENYKNAPSLIARSIFILTACFFIFLSETLEKFTHGGGAFFTENTACNIYLMIKFRFVKYIQYRTGTSGFRIPTSDHDSWNPCLYNGTGAHLTRFQCNVHGTFLQPPVSHCLAGLSNRLKFCMSKGIFIRIPPVIPSCNDLPIFYDHTTDRDFT